MKKRSLFGTAAILSLMLSVQVYAGDVQTPTIAPPPPPSSQQSMTATSTTSDTDFSSTDLITEIVLSLYSLV